MESLRVGVIGTGRKKDRPDATGYFMAYRHAEGYRQVPACKMVACADIVPENAEAFAAANEVAGVYTDYHEMLAKENLDMVSICTWPHLHVQMVLDAALAGVRAIHCEKPMSDTWGGSRLMAQECQRRGVQLTFNHQRRFGAPFYMAKQLLKEGVVGDLVRLEGSCGDMYDGGTHFIDMMGFFNDDVPAKWVLGQIDMSTEHFVFGAPVENQAICQWEYTNGIPALFIAGALGGPLAGAINRIVGTDGVIEVGVLPTQNPALRVRRKGSSEWETIDTRGESLHGPNFIERAIADTIAALREHREPELSARRALNATEIIFACYESSRRRGRVDLPLRTHDNALASMIASGDLKPAP